MKVRDGLMEKHRRLDGVYKAWDVVYYDIDKEGEGHHSFIHSWTRARAHPALTGAYYRSAYSFFLSLLAASQPGGGHWITIPIYHVAFPVERPRAQLNYNL